MTTTQMGKGIVDQVTDIQLLSFESWSARAADETLKECWKHEHSESAKPWLPQTAYCTLCRRTSMFTLAEGADPGQPNMREHIICSVCRLNSRVRAAFTVAVDELKSAVYPTVYLTEQASFPFAWAQKNFLGRVIGSEFESDGERRQLLAKYLRSIGGTGSVDFEDVTRLSFHDGTVDLLITMDVLEHVPEYERAIGEFARVLKPGGRLVATFPFLDAPATLTRAKWVGGQVVHCEEPEYHGDPLGSGILCWYHFGWDILDTCLRNGFQRAKMVMPWSPAAELRTGLWTLVAER